MPTKNAATAASSASPWAGFNEYTLKRLFASSGGITEQNMRDLDTCSASVPDFSDTLNTAYKSLHRHDENYGRERRVHMSHMTNSEIETLLDVIKVITHFNDLKIPHDFFGETASLAKDDYIMFLVGLKERQDAFPAEFSNAWRRSVDTEDYNACCAEIQNAISVLRRDVEAGTSEKLTLNPPQ